MDIPIKLQELRVELKKAIDENGFRQNDERLKRVTMSLPGHFVVVSDSALLEWCANQDLLDKYLEDTKRMYASFKIAVDEAKKNPNSRQLMVFNDRNFAKIHQCFTHFHFVRTERGEFDMYVYQRSSDMSKLKDDLIFFAHQMKKFQKKTGHAVTALVIIFGHIHYEIEA